VRKNQGAKITNLGLNNIIWGEISDSFIEN
jgi:hypothetical protein